MNQQVVEYSGQIGREVLVLPDRDTLQKKLAAVQQFQALVKATLILGHDYGVIPGTDKPTLLKPGAEKTAKLLECADLYEVVDSVQDWAKPFFHYLVRCRLVLMGSNPPVTVSEGVGECNSMEGKYRWRNKERICPVCGKENIIKGKEEYGGGWLCWRKKGGCGATFGDNDERITAQEAGKIENDDIYSQVNTLLKMAKKRALVDAALSAGRLSDIFTQDIEEVSGVVEGEAREIPPEAPHAPQKRTSARRSAATARTSETALEPDDLDATSAFGDPDYHRGERPAGRPVTTGPGDPASEQQRAYIERLLSDVGMGYADLRAEEQLRTLPEWGALTVGSVPLAVDWLLKRKRQAAAGAKP